MVFFSNWRQLRFYRHQIWEKRQIKQLCIVSLVNSILGCCEFRWFMNESTISFFSLLNVSSTNLNHISGGSANVPLLQPVHEYICGKTWCCCTYGETIDLFIQFFHELEICIVNTYFEKFHNVPRWYCRSFPQRFIIR